MNVESIQTEKPTEAGEHGPAMKGADVLVSALEREGVDVVFAYPGGASMELHQSLTRSEKIRTILPRQEQGVALWLMDTPERRAKLVFVWRHPALGPLILSHVLQTLTWTASLSLPLQAKYISNL